MCIYCGKYGNDICIMGSLLILGLAVVHSLEAGWLHDIISGSALETGVVCRHVTSHS